MNKHLLTIATRESPLALQQAESIKTLLQKQHPQLTIALLGMTTEGDQRLNVTLTEIGGKGLFVKELEEALLDGRADIAVHSMKDVPMDLPTGLCVPVMDKRAEPRDVFVSNAYTSFLQLPPAARVGTSSLRRQTQLHALRPDLQLQNLRGNIQTRLARLDQGDFAAIILAGAGLQRMQLAERIRSFLSIEESLPAAGQGALGIECRKDDEATQALIAPLNDRSTYICVQAERAFCRQLGGGCKVPVAAYAYLQDEKLILQGLVASTKRIHILKAQCEGLPVEAEALGMQLAHELIAQGAKDILRDYNASA